MPSILFINRVQPPSPGASGACLVEAATGFARAGWRVAAVTDGRVARVEANGVQTIRTSPAMAERDTPSVCGYMAVLARLTASAMRLERPDVVLSMTDPPFLALAGLAVARWHRSVSIHWCQDLYPDLLPVLGTSLPPPLLRAGTHACAAALRRHDAVIAIGRCMAQRLSERGIASDRLHTVPNWPEPAIGAAPHPRPGPPFTVLYAGNVGLAHPLDGLLAAAERVRHLKPEIRFIVAGRGRRFPALTRKIAERGLTNVRIEPWVEEDDLGRRLAEGHVHIAALAGGAEGLAVPRKVATAFASGRPCLFLGPQGSEAAHLIREYDCGTIRAADDVAGIVGALIAYRDHPDLRLREGRNALIAARALERDRSITRIIAIAEAALIRRATKVEARCREARI